MCFLLHNNTSAMLTLLSLSLSSLSHHPSIDSMR